MAQTKNIGLRSIINSSGYNKIDSNTISFGVAPRINACGRMGKSVGSLKINRERNGYLVTRELAYLASGPLVHIPFLCSKQWIILFFLHHRMAG